ncbi:restriction endonuclease subunit S [Burkholderiaceae bacterium FT117]|uniref:restriction endonuclease subunit S n=1 Tax=Zeimonas sediminis TaxID=2944268 RepID=UPI002342F262|nr:restriction endonuclease subunit S [Zeimonas sediminis]MCM5570494.1 restriction endonuclease subunit S [Zeimonas sediminis]
MIRGTDIPGALIGNVQSVPRRFHKISNLKSRKLEVGDLIFEVSGGSKDQPVGRSLYCSDRLLASIGGNVIPASFCKRIVPDTTLVDGRFIYYVLRCLYDDRRIAQWQVQSTGISNFQFEAFLDECEVDLPPLETQRRIASILSAYDDLIENNTRRIAILEEVARRIYEEWFVRFRFPGHEQVKMVESECGLIPEEWEHTTLGAVSEYINRGLTPKYDDLADGTVINQKCIRDHKLNYDLARRQSKAIPADKRIRYGDVLINSTGVGTLGRVAQVLDERPNCTVDTHVTIVRPGKQVTTHFYGLALLANEQYFEQQGVGATGQTELGRGRVAEATFMLPPLVVQERFDELVAPMRQMTITLTSKNANLRATRDLLLPKLISGELDVSSLPEPEEAIAA